MKYTSRELKSQATKKTILETAIELIKQKGYNNVSINEICAKSGLSKGAFYHHYDSKEDILIQLYKDVDDYYIVEVLPKLDSKNTIDKILFFVTQQAYCADGIGVDIVRQIYKGQTDNINKFITSMDRPFYNILKDIIIEGQNTDELSKDLSIDETINYILCFSRGIINDWCMHNGEYDLQNRMSKFFSMLVQSIKSHD